MNVILDPTIKSLKPLSKKQIEEYMNWFLKTSSDELGKVCEIQKTAGQNIATVFIENIKDGELFLNKIGMKSFSYINKFISEKLNDEPKDYKRDMILWESEIKDNRILIKF